MYTPERPRTSPLWLGLVRTVVDDVRRGRLRAGQRLPGSRSLAARLGVSRNTVVRAYEELAAEGWIATSTSGSFISSDISRDVRAGRRVGECGFSLGPRAHRSPPEVPRGLRMVGGLPDTRLLPLDELARAYRRVLRGPRARSLVDYGDPRGLLRLRQAIAQMLRTSRGLAVDDDEIVLTAGAQMALHLAARVLGGTVCKRIAVERFGYRPAWEAFLDLGFELVGIDVDDEGLCVDQLAAAGPLRAVYVTPHHQYPTGVTMSAARRLDLLAFASRERAAIIEDDYDHEVHYEGPPVLPLAAADERGVVLYVGSLSKAFAPGVRVGYLAGPRAVVERATAARVLLDRQGDALTQAALADLLEDGALQRHIWRATRVYRRRRTAMLEAIERHLPGVLIPRPARGGLALWCFSVHDDVDGWRARTAAREVQFSTARDAHLEGRRAPYVRLGFAALDEAEIERGVRTMAECL